jgi:hypothetical protein
MKISMYEIPPMNRFESELKVVIVNKLKIRDRLTIKYK